MVDALDEHTSSNERLARLLEELPETVVVLDSVGTLVWANAAAESLFGRSLEEAIGVSAIDFVHPDDLELALLSLESVQGREVGNSLEIRIRVGDEWRLVEVIGHPVGWFEDGAILLSLRDLTGRRRFEVARDDVARFRSLVHNATTITFLVSPAGRIDSVSGALTRMLGHDPELVEDQPLSVLVVEHDHPLLEAAFIEALAGATATHPVTVNVRLVRRGSGESVHYELSMVNLVEDSTVGGLVITAHDVSARVSAEQELHGALIELRDTFSLLTATLDSTADGLLVVDQHRNITSFNRQFAEMWRIPESLLASRDDVETLTFVVDQLVDPRAFLARVGELYSHPQSESRDTIVFKDGRTFERLSRPQRVAGEVVGRVWSFSDITEQMRLESDLAHLAFHDTLTGLANRALFKNRLDQAVVKSGRTGTYVAVLFLDLDDFKTINDSLGHSAGDELLGAVAEVLGQCLRQSDTAARLGGDEFAVLVEGIADHDSVVALADRIITAIRQPIAIGRQTLSVTASVGITFGVAGSTSDELLSNADLAMYTAKLQGKDRFVEFQAQMHTAVLERLELEADLRRAIAGAEFVVHYQPIVDIESTSLLGFEALVRWRHPTRGMLQPADFVVFAEEIGLIDSIDRFVLAEACQQARRWQSDGLASEGLLMSVNLSAREIVASTIGAGVADSLATSGFEPTNLVLEITESAVMKDVEAAVRNLYALSALGVRIAIDDFGTGYSSLSHLERLPIDILKIDRSFLSGIVASHDTADLAQAIVHLSRTLGLTAIAEGVESDAQVDCLLQMGCTMAQGYHLGVPLDATATEALLVSRRLAPAR
jgi:diguanylate cyclase (GGDEF)-like protein/PAS domain S-box-containing protein